MRIPRSFEELIEGFKSLPGIGRKTAERLSFYILSHREEGQRLGESLKNALESIKFCSICGNISDKDPCDICSDPKRDSSMICVVEKPMDLYAIEKTGGYKGLYHVLGGLISPLDGRGPEDIKIKELLKRINEDVKEVIIALKPTTEGEATSMYISNLLEPLDVKVSWIARGIPVGGDIDLTDSITLLRSIQNRNIVR
ncbi:recombination protein RecR [candidate division WOR-3 bacterium]|nr:recombination protein RecR [candidate division WOR-3 bacterium]